VGTGSKDEFCPWMKREARCKSGTVPPL